MRIVFASHTSFNPSLVVGSHHLATHLAQEGHRVLHLSAPLTLFHLAKFKNPRYRERWANWRNDGSHPLPTLIDYVPLSLVPWQLARRFPIARGNLFLQCQPSLSTILRRFDFESPDLLLVDEPRLAGIEKICRPKNLVYRSTDLNADFKNDSSILMAERWLIEHADALVGTSEPVLASLRSVAPEKPSLLLENGVDQTFFSTPRPEPVDLIKIPGPRVIYVGAVDERFDFKAIDALSRARPDLSIIIIGPVTVANPPVANNIHFFGSRPYLEIPAYLQHCQIGLLPLNGHLANRGRSPMKLYEYAAAGLPVVASATEELTRRREPFVTLFSDSPMIVPAISSALASPTGPAAAREAALSRDWKTLTDKLLSFTEKNF